MELIVTEKDNAARRIADILSDGAAGRDRRGGVPVYTWGDRRCIGLSGHVVEVDFPPEYADWRDVEPVELTEASVVKKPSKEDIVASLRSLAETADRAVIATDYDREGELIGKEAYELITETTDIPISRVRFSSLTEREVKNAFANPDELDFDLAAAGEARQIIDLVWGAALTRFLSLSAGQLGQDFISVGRVQSPTLKLIVDREREIEAFEPEDYWELFADLLKNDDEFEAQYFYEGKDGTEQERVTDQATAERVHGTLTGVDEAVVESVRRRTRTDDPPAPFNTTQYIRAAGSIGYSAQRAMSLAEDLYTAGYVTYPRTDNTVYPEDLTPEELLATFADTGAFGEDAASLLGDDVEPTRGDTESTDHPPIHPTGEIPGRQDLSEDEWEVYELIVRRFLATCADPAEWEHLRVVTDADGAALKANGKRLLTAGYHDVYPYFSTSENYVPDVETGERLKLTDARLEAKQTQPPRRRGQSRLIEEMESMGIGTKCVTADTDVLVRNSEGDIERQPVAELFDAEQVVTADGDTDVATTTGGPQTLSYDETTERMTTARNELISRRTLGDDERVVTIETALGSFSVTNDHPMYVGTEHGTTVCPAEDIEPGMRLLTARSPPIRNTEEGDVLLTWDEFATTCDWSAELYGTDCNEALAEARRATGETKSEFAERLGTSESYLSAYENGQRDVPVRILGELDIRPDRLRSAEDDIALDNPFPLAWSDELAQTVGSLLGGGSIRVDEEDNVIHVRYHNTDRRSTDRIAQDIESLFGIDAAPTEQADRDDRHRPTYRLNLPSAVGRVLGTVLDEVITDGRPSVPHPYRLAFVGALFDEEGYISQEGEAFIPSTDRDLLAGVAGMLADEGIDATLREDRHKLRIRGRTNLERFLDRVPIAAPGEFYRGIDNLRTDDITTHKAKLLELAAQEARTAGELAAELGMASDRVSNLVRTLREEGYIEKAVEGSNVGNDGNRTVRYQATGFLGSIYARVLGYPSCAAVNDICERDYDGPVYDLSVSDDAPNFAVEGGVIVHNSTRHNTLEKLYDRGYIEGDPPRPTTLAMAVVEAAEEFADHIVDERMTQQLERDMTAIAEGEKALDEVTAESREMLRQVFEDLHRNREEIGDYLRESLKEDKRLGPCPECGEQLLVRRSRQGSYFVGCDGFPDCRFTLPLPNTGEPTTLEETCEEHGLKHVKMVAGRSTFVHGCPRCKAEEADAMEDRIIGICPECGDHHDGALAIKQLQSGTRLVGCTRYPDCDYSLPLPRRGEIEVHEQEICDEHGLPALAVRDDDDDDDPWELGCPICNYEEYQERQAASELEDIDGVGAKTAEKLSEAGIDNLDDLRAADAETVAGEVQGVTADTVREWQTQA